MNDIENLEISGEKQLLDASPYPDNFVFTYHPNGKVKSITGLKDGKKHGLYYRVMTSGEIYEIRAYNSGLPVNLF